MAWGKIGADTATSATPTLKVDVTTPNNFVSFMNHIFVSGSNNNHEISFNSDQAYVYAHRSSTNGGTDGAYGSQREIGGLSNNSSDKMQVGYIADFAGEEKLCIMFQFDAMPTGAGNAPTRCESYFKYVPASASRLTDIVSHDDQWFSSPTADRYATNSNLTLLGSDLTPSAGRPTDVQVGSRWEETDTRKMYHKVDNVTGSDVSLTGLNAYFKFNEASGDLINHASSVGSTDEIAGNGTNSNVTYSQTGKIGSTYSYNGTSSKTEIDTLIPTSQTGSVFWWWKSSDGIDVIWGWGDTNADTFIFQEGTGSGESFTIYARNGGANKWWAKPSSNISSPLNTWHSACITHDGTAPLIYVDGVEGTTFTNSTDKTWWVPDFSGIDNFSLGFERRNNGLHNYFNGNIDELSVWSRALTAAEISTLHNSGTGKEINSDVWKEEGT